MMGSGKTTIGSIISKKLKINFIDIDQEIEKELGITIPKIFEIKGEKYFREIEEKITVKILKQANKVISLGGGAFLNENIQNEILEKHVSFWLNCDPATLVKRISYNTKRPVAFRSSKNELFNLIKKRSRIYSKALYKIDCKDLSKNEIVKIILKKYETYKTNSQN